MTACTTKAGDAAEIMCDFRCIVGMTVVGVFRCDDLASTLGRRAQHESLHGCNTVLTSVCQRVWLHNACMCFCICVMLANVAALHADCC
jgi:hypothetical protein